MFFPAVYSLIIYIGTVFAVKVGNIPLSAAHLYNSMIARYKRIIEYDIIFLALAYPNRSVRLVRIAETYFGILVFLVVDRFNEKSAFYSLDLNFYDIVAAYTGLFNFFQFIIV